MILHNAPEDTSKALINYFTNLINWSNKRLNILNIIVTQKMGLFRHRSFHHDQLSEYNRQHGNLPKVSSFVDYYFSFFYSIYFSIQRKMIMSILNKSLKKHFHPIIRIYTHRGISIYSIVI